MHIDGLNEEFKTPDNAASGTVAPAHATGEGGEVGEPMPSLEDRPVNVLDPETEARVKANHERFMKAAPVPKQLSGDALEAQGFTVRKIGG
jgi:hypothetical protein